MAIKYPLTINNVKFTVNPKNISNRKQLNIAQLDTMGGRQYQVWWPAPEVVTIQGETFGDTAYSQLMFLKRHYDSTKVSTLTYKVHTYTGYITGLDVTADTGNLQVWIYTINFQLLHGQKFFVEDFAVTSTPIIGGTVGQILNQIEEATTNAPSSITNYVNARLGTGTTG